MDSERDPSISSLIALCVREFNALLASIPNEKIETRLKLQDDLGRLRVWIGNFGAHRKQTDRLSLDHRLREAPELHHEVRNHINDISEAIYGATSYIQESEKPFEIDETPPTSEMNDLDSDDSDSDGFWDQVKAENEKHSKLEEYLHDIQFIITSLYKFSVTLQNPAHRDRTVQASRIDLDHFEFYDVQHVSEKFKLPRESMLAQRLGKANTKRRQLLAYHKDHAEKISKYVDVAMENAVKPTKDQIKHNDLDMSSSGPQSISTKWTQDTTVSTINHQDIDVASDSGQTKFSVTTSTAGDQAHDLMPPPPADVVNTVQNSLFFCPYCRQMIQLENVDEDWNYHVLSDLRPYICTFGNCAKANQLYDSYTEWNEHEQQFHRREWFCNLCLSTYQSETFFWKHLEDAHAETIPEDQRRAVVKLSERSMSSAQQCPLCTKSPISNPRRFQQHLARHLQQLSLFVLPLPESEENEHSIRDGESNESRKALMLDGEARESLKSTSTNQESRLTGKSPTLSEGSSPYDQLEVIEVETRRGYQGRDAKEHQELDDDERTTMSGHSSTLKNMANLESISQLLGRSQKAENLEGEVLETHKNMRGEEEHAVTLHAPQESEGAEPLTEVPKERDSKIRKLEDAEISTLADNDAPTVEEADGPKFLEEEVVEEQAAEPEATTTDEHASVFQGEPMPPTEQPAKKGLDRTKRYYRCHERGCGTEVQLKNTFKRHVGQHYPCVDYYCHHEGCRTRQPFHRRDKIRDHHRMNHGATREGVPWEEIYRRMVPKACPPICAVCCLNVSDWAAFYECYADHCEIVPEPRGLGPSCSEERGRQTE